MPTKSYSRLMGAFAALMLTGGSALSVTPMSPETPDEIATYSKLCISSAVEKLPRVPGLMPTASRATRARETLGPSYTGMMVEIDASVAGQQFTYVFACATGANAALVVPVGRK
jgi:hypothetical protein